MSLDVNGGLPIPESVSLAALHSARRPKDLAGRQQWDLEALRRLGLEPNWIKEDGLAASADRLAVTFVVHDEQGRAIGDGENGVLTRVAEIPLVP